MTPGNVLEGIFRMLSAPDEKVRKLGVKALGEIPPDRLAQLLRDPGLSPQARAFLCPGMSSSPKTPEAERGPAPEPAGGAPGEASGEAFEEAEGPGGTPGGEPGEEENLNKFQQVMRMGAGQKIKAAFKGDKEMRTLLIRDSNREVYMSVLENPGITESEIDAIAKNSGTHADILRKIARNKDWMANHAILKGLVTNPKTPIEVSNRFLTHLGDKELELLEASKNLPAALRTNAKRVRVSRKKKEG